MAHKITARLLSDTGSSSSDSNTSSDTLTGTASAGALITFTINGSFAGTTIPDASGNWTFTPIGLPDGTYNVVVSQLGSSTSLTFTLDTTAPVITEQLVSDTGALSTDNITSKPALTA